MSMLFDNKKISEVILDGIRLDKITLDSTSVFERPSTYSYASNLVFLGSTGNYYVFYNTTTKLPEAYSPITGEKVFEYDNYTGYDLSNVSASYMYGYLKSGNFFSPSLYFRHSGSWEYSDEIYESDLKDYCYLLHFTDDGFSRYYPFKEFPELTKEIILECMGKDTMGFFELLKVDMDSDNNKLLIYITISKIIDHDGFSETIENEYCIEIDIDNKTYARKFINTTYYTIDEEGSNLNRSYTNFCNIYTGTRYEALKEVDNSGDTTYYVKYYDKNDVSHLLYSGSTESDIYLKIKNIKYSIYGTDVMVGYLKNNNYGQYNGSFTMYAFRDSDPNTIVTSVITSSKYPTLIGSSNDYVELIYDCGYLYFVNHTLRKIVPLKLNMDDLTITV